MFVAPMIYLKSSCLGNSISNLPDWNMSSLLMIALTHRDFVFDVE